MSGGDPTARAGRRTGRGHRRWPRALWLLVLAALCPLACGDAPGGTGGADGPAPGPAAGAAAAPRVLAWQPADPGVPLDREVVTVERLSLLDGQNGRPGSAWTVQAPVWGEAVPDWLPPGSEVPMLMAAARRRERRIVYGVERPFDLTGFNQVAVVGTAQGAGGLGLSVDFLNEQGVVARLASERFNRKAVEVLEMPVSLEPGASSQATAIVIRVMGHDRQVGLSDVLLQRVPPAAALPAELGPVTVGEVERQAQPLVVGRPLTLEVPAGAGDRLSLALGQPEGARRTGAVDVRLTADGEPVWEGRVGEQDRWDTVTWQAVPGARLELTARGPAGAAVAVTRPVLFAPVEQPPTVLLITSDTHRADHLGVSGAGVAVETPWLDGLAARGLRFSDCFAPINNTNPSHVALMTGVHPRDTGVLDNYQPVTGAPTTLAEVFAGAGWATLAANSSKHLGPEGSGLGQGFEAVAWSERLPQRDSQQTLEALEPLLEEVSGRPLFLWVHLFDAHTPYQPPAELAARYYPADRDPRDPAQELGIPSAAMPPDMRDVSDLEYPGAMYRAEVSYTDAQMARLARHPRLATALTAVVADHGESLGENGSWFNHAGLYSASLHIPLLLAGPGLPSALAGTVEQRPVQHLDLGRTLLDLAGLEQVAFPGRSLLEPGRPTPRFAVEANAASAAVTMEGWHLVLHLMDRQIPTLQESHPRHSVELFDLTRDPLCGQDLSEEDPARTARLRRLLIDWLSAARDRGWAGSVESDPETLAALAQLGYAGPTSSAGAGALWRPDGCQACRRWED